MHMTRLAGRTGMAPMPHLHGHSRHGNSHSCLQLSGIGNDLQPLQRHPLQRHRHRHETEVSGEIQSRRLDRRQPSAVGEYEPRHVGGRQDPDDQRYRRRKFLGYRIRVRQRMLEQGHLFRRPGLTRGLCLGPLPRGERVQLHRLRDAPLFGSQASRMARLPIWEGRVGGVGAERRQSQSHLLPLLNKLQRVLVAVALTSERIKCQN